MEARVFLLGIYKNYEELEENMSMPELLGTLEAHEKEKFKDRQFMAATQGVELNDPFATGPSLDDIKKRVAARGSGMAPDDAVLVADEIGLGYEQI